MYVALRKELLVNFLLMLTPAIKIGTRVSACVADAYKCVRMRG
jgi:hypothetical protein